MLSGLNEIEEVCKFLASKFGKTIIIIKATYVMSFIFFNVI